MSSTYSHSKRMRIIVNVCIHVHSASLKKIQSTGNTVMLLRCFQNMQCFGIPTIVAILIVVVIEKALRQWAHACAKSKSFLEMCLVFKFS